MSTICNIQNSKTAFLFSKNLLKKNHMIKNIFFYSDGVFNGNSLVNTNHDEINLVHQWYKLSTNFKIKLNVCSSSAQERGIISREISQQFGILNGNMHHGFNLSSLGQLMKAILQSDRVLQF
ncbi:sulfurtransferase complex subunit TusD [Buchnera aphidicola (Shivaphis celti)]